MAEFPYPPPGPTGNYGDPPPPEGYGGYRAPAAPEHDPELVAMKRRIDRMQTLYLVLFISSLVLMVVGWQVQLGLLGNVAWASALGGAVFTRIRRQSIVRKYNLRLSGGAPTLLT